MTFSLFVSKTLPRSAKMMMGSATQATSTMNPRPMGQQESEKAIGRVLIADEDYSVRRALHNTLFEAGFDITEASAVAEAVALVQAVRCDVALVDIRMAGRQPGEVCGELRGACPALRVLMLTAGENENDQLEALDAGADDCIAKPLRMGEVMARVRAAMRRTQTPQVPTQATIRIGEIEANLSRRVVYKAGTMIHLTPKEFDLLVYLMMHAGIPIPHRKILTAVWGQEHGSRLDYLRTFVRQLRRKLEDHVDSPRYLLTNNYIGYRFADKTEVPAA
jgi:two-component system KDP operon response regulator KdpE